MHIGPFAKTNEDGTIDVIPSFVIAGYLTAIVFFSIWIFAAGLDGHWIFGWNALSDLGVAQNAASRILFNYGCIVTAFCGALFGMGLIKYERGCMYVAGIFVFIGILFLMGVGAIPEDYGAPHGISASTFGGFASIAMIFSAVGDGLKGRKTFSAIAVVLLVVNIGLGASMKLADLNFGYFEAIAIINVLIWVLSQSIKYHQLIGTITIDDPIAKIMDVQ